VIIVNYEFLRSLMMKFVLLIHVKLWVYVKFDGIDMLMCLNS